MESQPAARSDSLRRSYWRKEILQLLLWTQGEGFSDHLDAGLLGRALGVGPSAGLRHLDELVEEGLLSCDGSGRYRLTDAGQRYGTRLIADAFVDPDLGVCGLDSCAAPAVRVGRRLPRRVRPRPRCDGRRLGPVLRLLRPAAR